MFAQEIIWQSTSYEIITILEKGAFVVSKKVLISGAWGKMGQQVVKSVVRETDNQLVGAFDKVKTDLDIIEELGLEGEECLVYGDLNRAIKETNPEVIIDFTSPAVVMDNIEIGLKNQVDMIVGTTGITDADKENIRKWSSENDCCCFIVPNFALGAVLMMDFAARAAKYLPDVEIIELHHDQKIDAPSGTSLKTAEVINDVLREETGSPTEKQTKQESEEEYIEKLSGVRGGQKEEVNIHSVRLPGLVAHQEVIFGAEGQTLTLRHDSYDRTSFMPGVKMALEAIDGLQGVVYGLEKIMD